MNIKKIKLYNYVSFIGTSPLYRAILSNSAKTVQLLIAAKADVNMRRMGFDSKDMKAETPLIKYENRIEFWLKVKKHRNFMGQQ